MSGFPDVSIVSGALGAIAPVTSTISSVTQSLSSGVSSLASTATSIAPIAGFPNVSPLIQSGFNPDTINGLDITDSQFSAQSAATGSLSGSSSSDLGDTDKRLHVVRSRAAKTLYSNNGNFSEYTSDRGQFTVMKLLKNKDYDVAAAVKDKKVDGEVSALLNGTFASFFVTSISTNLSEKTQIMTTFGDNEVVYYFGKQPITMTINGLLFDSLENDWFSKFLTLYLNVLRGSELARSFSLVQLVFPNMTVTGSISNLNTQQSSDRDTDIPFSMTFIVKEILPTPIELPSGTAQNMSAGLFAFSGASASPIPSLSLGSLGGGFLQPISNGISSLGSLGGALSGSSGVGSVLNSFRTNIFSPVFGIISTITKVVKSVTGSIASIISSFTNPINAVLRDIRSIAAQATGLALMVENSINDIISAPARVLSSLRNTLTSLKNTAGVISRVPENISETFRRLYGGGHMLHGAAILSSGKSRTKSKAAVLVSGKKYSPSTSNTL